MQHPIEDLMKTTMHNLKAMVDVNTILGKPVSTQEGSIILTVSKVSFGFGAGGSDFQGEGSLSLKRPRNKFHPNVEKTLDNETEYPFGGGSGAGVSINPVAFLVVGEKGVRVMHLQNSTHLIEKVMETAPKTIQSIQKARDATSTAKDG